MVIGDITYANNEAVDDNIFSLMSVYVKAVLTQPNGTLNHPQVPEVLGQQHTNIQTNMVISLHIFQLYVK